MSSRLVLTVAVLAAVAMGSRPAAQGPSLAEVLQRAAACVKRFQAQLSEIVAEETCHQVVYRTGPYQK